jgi:hypothetical protein
MPTSSAMPTIANAIRPQSRNVMLSGVPSNADIVILSNTTSIGSGASSGVI